jgi:hypothetical protein
MCPVGKYDGVQESGTASDCKYCEIGKYNEAQGAVACISCPAGKTTQDSGANSVSDCVGAVTE